MVMDSNQKTDIPAELTGWLRKIPVFSSLDDAQRTALAQAGHVVEMPAEQRVLSKGDTANRLYLVCRGQVQSVPSDEHAIDIPPGTAFCVGALFDDLLVSSDINTGSDAELFVLPREAWSAVLFEDPVTLGGVLESMERFRRQTGIPLMRGAGNHDALGGMRRVEFFGDLDTAALHTLHGVTEMHTLSPGESLTGEGDDMFAAFFESGSFVYEQAGMPDRELHAGDVLGAEGLLQARRYGGELRCLQSGRVITLSRRSFLLAVCASPPLFTALMSAFAYWQRAFSAELTAIELAVSGGKLSPDVMRAKVRRADLFRHWGDRQIQALTDRATLHHLSRGQMLFELGDQGDEMYIILSGALQIRFRAEDGEYLDIATLDEGDSVGEMALIEDAPRSADAVAIVDTELLSIDREGFNAMLENSPKLISALLTGMSSMLRQTNVDRGDPETAGDEADTEAEDPAPQRVTFFNLLDSDSRNLLAQAGREVELATGELLFQEGEVADAMYVILRGGIEIFQYLADGNELSLAQLGEGDVFGEIAVIDGQPRSASARTRSTTELFALDREVFLKLLSQTPPLLYQVLGGLAEKVRIANQENRKVRAQYS